MPATPNTLEGMAYDRILWLDLEFTGLEIKDDLVIEVGAIVTDPTLREIASYESFVHHPPEVINALMSRNPWWQARPAHLAEMSNSVAGADTSLKRVGDELATFAAEHCPTPILLAGSSIHNDRRWVRRDFGELERLLHYRMLDVSSFAILAASLGVQLPAREERHRSIDDLRQSHELLRFVMRTIGAPQIADIYA